MYYLLYEEHGAFFRLDSAAYDLLVSLAGENTDDQERVGLNAEDREILRELEMLEASLEPGSAAGTDTTARLDLREITLLPDTDGSGRSVEELVAAAARLLRAHTRATPGQKLHIVASGAGAVLPVMMERFSAAARQEGLTAVVQVENLAGLTPAVVERLRALEVAVRFHFDPDVLEAPGPELSSRLPELVSLAYPQIPSVAISGHTDALIRTLEQVREWGFPGVTFTRSDQNALASNGMSPLLESYFLGLTNEAITRMRANQRPFMAAEWGDLIRSVRAGAWVRPADPAGLHSLTLDEAGCIYPGRDYVGREEFALGTIDSGLDVLSWRRFVTALAEAARACPVVPPRYGCGGRMLRKGSSGDGSRHHDCRRIRRLLEFGLHLYSRITEENPGLIPWDSTELTPVVVSEGTYEAVCVNP